MRLSDRIGEFLTALAAGIVVIFMIAIFLYWNLALLLAGLFYLLDFVRRLF